MTAHVSSRLRDLFLVPAEHAPARRVAERAVPATVGVLATSREGAVAAAAVALALAAARRERCAVVCRWEPRDVAPRAGWAAPPARRLAERLARRGVRAAARGRLVTVALAADPVAARAEAERVLAAVGETPVALLVAGPRPEALDPLLATLDRLVVVAPPDAPPGLEGLALEEAAALGRSVARLDLPDTPLGTLVAAAGRPLSPAVRAAATAALGGDRDA
jgi:hypothetical protein